MKITFWCASINNFIYGFIIEIIFVCIIFEFEMFNNDLIIFLDIIKSK